MWYNSIYNQVKRGQKCIQNCLKVTCPSPTGSAFISVSVSESKVNIFSNYRDKLKMSKFSHDPNTEDTDKDRVLMLSNHFVQTISCVAYL